MPVQLKVERRVAVEGPEEVAQLWQIYRTAFAPLATATPMRHGSYAQVQFEEVLADPEFLKFLVYADGVLAGLCLVTANLDKVPWVNPHYFTHRYPKLVEQRKLYYLPAVVVDPAYQDARRVGAVLLAESVRGLDPDGLLVVDYSDKLRAAIPAFVERALGADVEEEILDRQVFASYAYKRTQAPG